MAVITHKSSLADAADRLWEELPGHRVEILYGSIVVTPPPDGTHQETLSGFADALHDAGARKAGLRYLQGIGLWLPTGPADYAVPDLSIVGDDYKDAVVEKNCYAPHVFRLVLEVTSSNWGNDLMTKVEAYARANVPVYLVVDRKHGQVLVHSGPVGDAYGARSCYQRGQTFSLPSSVGVSLDLSVDTLLDGD